jgi:predicted dehydrogenase
MWNFPPHDISIIQYWLDDQESTSVLRQRMDCIQPGIDDVGFLNLAYPSEVISNVQVSWLDPQKVRRMTVVGWRKTVMYNNVADDKIAIHDKGIDRKAVLGERTDFDQPLRRDFSYRSGEILLPHVNFVEPLRLEAEHFTHPRTVASILERADAAHAPSGA